MAADAEVVAVAAAAEAAVAKLYKGFSKMSGVKASDIFVLLISGF